MRPDTQPTPPEPVRLADYTPPDWLVDQVHLTFDLAETATRVRAQIVFRRNPERPFGPLRLDGRRLALVSAAIDGVPVPETAMETTLEGLTVSADALPRDSFTWTCETEIDPKANTELEGLYLSKGMYCTQCEAEGFRKITYYPDRPDVMAPFRVRIEADKAVPIVLSNGNPGATSDLADGRHFAEWDDPWPKPAYLFALVAGDLVAQRDRFTTASGRSVDLAIWVRPGDETRCAYAMDALIRSMRWDEETHGREYDLEVFQIVAVDDFNMGAMENKGLNIFNAKFVLASPETATDADYANIEAIVAHEYFHNWTGNRITCRDWFQLCLKEGLTVFRDQVFSEDMRSAAVGRIQQVRRLRASQFPEDQGPLAHPVRPESYVEINNFYTATVYEKGAEVIRMLRTLVGAEGYRKALDLYFRRHDGQACTIEQFRQCFEDATDQDLTQFARWWSQAGTPRLTAQEDWDGETLTLTLSQNTPPTPGKAEKAPQVIPVSVGVLDDQGREVSATEVLTLSGETQAFEFDRATGAWNGKALPTSGGGFGRGEAMPPLHLSLLRGFSAPVILDREVDDAERAFLLAHDNDPFNRWEAGRRLAISVTLRALDGDPIPALWTDAVGHLLRDDSLDPAFRALTLALPGDDEIAAEVFAHGTPADPARIRGTLREMARVLGTALAPVAEEIYRAMAVAGPYSPDAAAAGRRSLRNGCLGLLINTGTAEAQDLAERQFTGADNMTDSMAGLAALVYHDASAAPDALSRFYDRWQADPLVVDKWFAVQATAPLPGTLAKIEGLTAHAAFDWKTPNRFRSLVGAFAMGNPSQFHTADGSGYRFVADWLIKLDKLNPQTAARLTGCFESWRRYDPARQQAIQGELARIAETDGLSRNTGEMVARMRVE
ncbi:MAG: aminopeptidase N [Pseudomonadota bacterium]